MTDSAEATAEAIEIRNLEDQVGRLTHELDIIKGKTFSAEGSAFKGLDSKAVRWRWSPGGGRGKRGQVLICRKCGAKLGPDLKKTPTGLM